MSQVASSAPPDGRHQRKLKNYLLDPHFQLKYSAYLVGIAVVLSVSLGAILWRTSEEVIAQSRANVQRGQQVVKLGREVVAESRKVSEVVKMNIVRDPVYQDNPALLEAFTTDAEEQDQRLKTQENNLIAQARSLQGQAEGLERFQTRMLTTLFGVLSLLVLGIFVAGIVVTHKVAGPIYKMKRQLKDVGKGHLRVPGKLRKGDELVHFFETFDVMVRRLRQRQEREIAMLDEAIQSLDGKADPASLEPLLELKKEMQSALEV